MIIILMFIILIIIQMMMMMILINSNAFSTSKLGPSWFSIQKAVMIMMSLEMYYFSWCRCWEKHVAVKQDVTRALIKMSKMIKNIIDQILLLKSKFFYRCWEKHVAVKQDFTRVQNISSTISIPDIFCLWKSNTRKGEKIWFRFDNLFLKKIQTEL